MAGQIDMMIEPSSNFVAQVQADTVKALAVPAKTRHPGMPDVPTMDEAGLPGFYASIWFGLWAPKDTPKDIIAKLNAATVAALADPDVKAKLSKLGQQVVVARSANAGSARRLAKVRGRQMVADHQGREHQGRMKSSIARGGGVTS